MHTAQGLLQWSKSLDAEQEHGLGEKLIGYAEAWQEEVTALLKSRDHYISEWSDACDQNQGLRNELAESQAREKALLKLLGEALESLERLTSDQGSINDDYRIYDNVVSALTRKPNNSALKAALAAEKERCAKKCDARRRTVSNGNGTSYWSTDPASLEAGYCAADIRADE